MKRYSSDRPYGWPAKAAGHRRHDGGDTMSLVPEILTHELMERRAREASDNRMAALAKSASSRPGFVTQLRSRVGGAVTAFGRVLAGEPSPGGSASGSPRIARTLSQQGARGATEPGC